MWKEWKSNRYFILVMAAIVNFVHGNPYIWTVFQPYMEREFDISTAASSQPFTVIIGIFAFGNMIGGWLQHKIGAKRTALAGSAFMCLGFLMAALAPKEAPWLVTLGYGAIGGLGSGCAFSMLVAIPQGWFPDKRGLVTGITIGVIGLSGVIMNPLCDWLLAAKGFHFAMLMVTVFYAVLCLGAFFLEEAPLAIQEQGAISSAIQEQGVMTGGPKEQAAAAGSSCGQIETAALQRQYTAGEMMRTGRYYWLSLAMALAVPAYVLVNPLMMSLGMERGLTGAQALAGVTAASAANIIGRVAAPWLSDRAGRKPVVYGLFMIAMAASFGLMAATGMTFAVLCSAICMVYGGVVSVFPVMVSDYFGMKHQGTNFGAVMIGYGIASILCPLILAAAGQEKALLIAGVCCVAGLFATRRI